MTKQCTHTIKRKPTEHFEIGRYVTGTFDGKHYEAVILKLHWDEDAADDFQDCWIKENPEKFECHSSNAANDDMEEMDPPRKISKTSHSSHAADDDLEEM